MTATSYQTAAVESALNVFRYAEECYRAAGSASEHAAVRALNGCVLLEAPTGAGKTRMAGMICEELAKASAHPQNAPVVWFWFAPFASLCKQTKGALTRYFHGLNVRDIYSERQAETAASGDMYVMTWASVAAKDKDARKIRQGGERAVSLDEFIPHLRDLGFRIGVIVDEAHHGFVKAKQAQIIYSDVLKPDFTLQITATPDQDDIKKFSKAAGIGAPHHISVSRRDAVDAGLIKDGVRAVAFLAGDAERHLMQKTLTALSEGLTVHHGLKSCLQDIGVAITPLMLVQVGNNDDAVTKARTYLMELGVHEDKIASYTANEPNDDLLSVAIDDRKEFLIFKVAAATGFDAPRAFTLVSLRPAKDTGFGVQTVGRILRVHPALRKKTMDGTLPDVLRNGYVILADAEYQEGLIGAGQRINAISSRLTQISPYAMVVRVGGNDSVQYVKDGKQPALLPPDDIPYTPPSFTINDKGELTEKPPIRKESTLFPGFAPQPDASVPKPPSGWPSLKQHSYTLRNKQAAHFYTEMTGIDTSALIQCIIRNIKLDERALMAAQRRYLTVKRKDTDIFTGDTGYSDTQAMMSQREITRRAEQLHLLIGGDISIRDIRAPLLKRLEEEYKKAGWEPENLSSALNMIIATHPTIIKNAVKECKAKYKDVRLTNEPFPEMHLSAGELLPSPRNLYGIIPEGLNNDEKQFVDMIDADDSCVEWWLRNPPRTGYSCGLLRANGGMYYPDFILKIKGRTRGEGGILLVEPKGGHILNDPGTLEKAQTEHGKYGKPLILTKSGDGFVTVEYDAKTDKCLKDRMFRPELMVDY